MRRLVLLGSELSLASAAFFFTWALLGLVSFALRVTAEPMPSLTPLALGLASLMVGIGILVWGRTYPLRLAIPVTVFFSLLILGFATVVDDRARLLSLGLFVYPFAMSLVWFLPRGWARALAYGWLGVFAVVFLVRVGMEALTILVTLALSAVLVAELVGVFRDRLEHAVLTDPLCLVWNRQGFAKLTDQAIAAAARRNEPVSVLFADLDGFKIVNDLYGHAEGDRVRRDFAAALARETRAADTVARMGGDEFAILMPATTAAQALGIGHRLRERVTEAQWSLGVVELGAGETVHSFIARADDLMRAEKTARKAGRPTAVPVNGAGDNPAASVARPLPPGAPAPR